MTESVKSKLWWLAGLFVRLGCISLLGVMLWFALVTSFGKLKILTNAPTWLTALFLLIGYTWAIYFRFPFFQSRTSRQRLLISAVIAVPTIFLTYCCVIALLNAVFIFAFPDKSEQRTESVTLPSGDVLENHTYYGEPSLGGSGERVNKLFLNNPAKGTSELVGDLNYEADQDTPSLLAKSSHPQEFIYGDKKVLVIGSYLCERIIFRKVPDWNITFINPDTEAQAYLKSFLPTNDILSHLYEIGLHGRVPFVFDNLDLTNNILTLKKEIPEERHSNKRSPTPISILRDEFPPYLVYSAIGFNGSSLYQFPLKFDIARTKAKNGPLWDNPMPPDSSSIIVQSATFGTRGKIADVTTRVIELLHTNADGFVVNGKTLGCDPFPGRKKHLKIKYEFKDFNFTSTVAGGDDVSYQTLINNARK